MQFSEHLVFPNFDDAVHNFRRSKKKLNFSHYAKHELRNISITKIIDCESNFHESPVVCSFQEETPKKLNKKFSIDDIATVQKATQSSLDFKNCTNMSRSGSALSLNGDHNSYFSCMANIEINKADEPTWNNNNDFKFDFGAFSKGDREGTLKPNYEDLKKQLKIKIESLTANRRKARLRSNSEFKKMSKHYERKEFVKLSTEDVLHNFEMKNSKRSLLSSKLYDVRFV